MRISNNPTKWTVLLLLGLVTLQDYAQADSKVQRQHLVTDVGHYRLEQKKMQQDQLKEFEKASDVDDTTHLQQSSRGMSQGNITSMGGSQKLSEKQNEPSNKQQIELSLDIDGPIETKIGEANSTKILDKSDKDHI